MKDVIYRMGVVLLFLLYEAALITGLMNYEKWCFIFTSSTIILLWLLFIHGDKKDKHMLH